MGTSVIKMGSFNQWVSMLFLRIFYYSPSGDHPLEDVFKNDNHSKEDLTKSRYKKYMIYN